MTIETTVAIIRATGTTPGSRSVLSEKRPDAQPANTVQGQATKLRNRTAAEFEFHSLWNSADRKSTRLNSSHSLHDALPICAERKTSRRTASEYSSGTGYETPK